jgi:hypothetical protein
VRHGCRRDAVALEFSKRRDARPILADAGVVEHIEPRGDGTRVAHHARTAVGTGDDDGAGVSRPDRRDGVEQHDLQRSTHCGSAQ